MTDFVAPSYKTNGTVIDEDDWNGDLVDNLIALNERLPNNYAYAIVENTTTPTAVMTQTIAAGALGANGFLIVELAAVIQNASGSTRYPAVAIKYGSDTFISLACQIATSANRISYRGKFVIQNIDDDAIQLSTAEQSYLVSPGAASSVNTLTHTGTWKDQTVDTSVSQDLTVVVTLDAADASYIFEMLGGTIIGPVYKE